MEFHASALTSGHPHINIPNGYLQCHYPAFKD